jgi:ATP-dependent DNA helicase RecG
MKLSKSLLHTTESYIQRLARWGIETVEDLLLFFPRDIENTADVIDSFAYVNIQEKNTIKVTLINILQEQTRFQKKLTKFLIVDKNGMSSECVFFHTPFFKQPIKPGDTIIIHGKPKYEYGKLSFPQPDIELYDTKRQAYLPIYMEIQGINTKWFREKIPLLFEYLKNLPEVLPEEIRHIRKHRPRIENIRALHAPETLETYELAKHELAYEELFELQYKALQRKKIIQEASIGHVRWVPLDTDFMKEIIATLPFPLTNHQKITLFEILKDMERDICMQRLLQGDVGTGKTIVAFLSLLHWIRWSGWQVAYMAPTTILATQVAKKLKEFLEPYGITSALLLWSLKTKEKKDIKTALQSGELSVVVGTHALIQEDVSYKHLSYVIIDEQHRFGVEQREKLTEYVSHVNGWTLHVKSWSDKDAIVAETLNVEHLTFNTRTVPHVLMMTATPIPRTLSMALYGNQDISLIREYPANRKPIQTKIVTPAHAHEAYAWIESQLKNGHQAYWISPLVEQSDAIDAVSVHETAEKLSMLFPHRAIGILHGRMSADEKETIMSDFIAGHYDILSSTSVVEVGVDNPNATVICIEDAERFGLSQLHQFRGRVGRGDAQSYCYLLSEKTNAERLRALEKTNDGFEISEIDMQLRGPGEVYGVRQSGIPDLKLASIMDLEKIYEIRKDIELYLKK